MGKKTDYAEVIAGAAIIVGTVANIIPGDEIVGVPLGVLLIIEGMGWKNA